MKKILLTITLISTFFLINPSSTNAACGILRKHTEGPAEGLPIGCFFGETSIGGWYSCGEDDFAEYCCNQKAECSEVWEDDTDHDTDIVGQEILLEGPDNDFFDALNPLVTDGDPAITADLSTPGGIVSRLLQFLFPISALILFVMLIWGGFEILSKSTQGTKGVEAGRNRITAAIVGFLLLFATYWMAQIIEVIFGIVIV